MNYEDTFSFIYNVTKYNLTAFLQNCSLCDCDKNPNREVFEKYVVSIFPSQDHPQHSPIHRAHYDRDIRKRGKAVSYDGRPRSCSQDSRDVISAEGYIYISI